MLENLIVEGVDRLGKSTLIEGFRNRMGYFQVLHYQKPELLAAHRPKLTEDETRGQSSAALEIYTRKVALENYQRASFGHMMTALSTTGRYICDRSHLGEAVYAKRYRGYDGDYVFKLEEESIARNQQFYKNTLLVLLTTSDFSFITDDGLSHDFSKKEEEQEDFKRAFNYSIIKNKLMINVSNGHGGYKPACDILELVVNAFFKE